MAHPYPSARARSYKSRFHGSEVADPFVGLEQEGDGETIVWRVAQGRLARAVLDRLEERDAIAGALDAAHARSSTRLPIELGGENFDIVAGGEGGIALVHQVSRAALFDAAALAPNVVHDGFVYPAPGGRYLAFGVGAQGSDWLSLRIYDRREERFLDETLPEGAHPIVTWSPDGASFYYNRTSVRFRGGAGKDGIYLHRIGVDPAEDALVFDHSNLESHAALPLLLRAGELLIIKTIDFTTQKAALHVHRVGLGLTRCVFHADAAVNVVGDDGKNLILETDAGAENGRIVTLDPYAATPHIETLVAERREPLEIASHCVQSPVSCVSGGRIFALYGEGGAHQLRAFEADGADLGAIELHEFVSVTEVRPVSAGVEAALVGYRFPFAYLRIDAKTLAPVCLAEAPAPAWLQRARVERRFVERDGVSLPVYIIGDAARADPSPTLLYGYGGWGTSVTPEFRADLAAWLALGGVYAVANVRGGGEYGAAWRRAGSGLNRATAIDDFCAIGRALVEGGIARADALVARGLSNGGLLVSAAANRAPELFAAFAAEVPLVDVLHLKRLPLGATMVGEFGDPDSDADAFAAMRGYSPLQNLAVLDKRPAAFIAPADKDERVPAGQAYKYVAALQALARDGQVALMRLVEGEGHVGWRWASTRALLIDELSFLWSACSGRLPQALEDSAHELA